jgi:hypothetical protein
VRVFRQGLHDGDVVAERFSARRGGRHDNVTARQCGVHRCRLVGRVSSTHKHHEIAPPYVVGFGTLQTKATDRIVTKADLAWWVNSSLIPLEARAATTGALSSHDTLAGRGWRSGRSSTWQTCPLYLYSSAGSSTHDGSKRKRFTWGNLNKQDREAQGLVVTYEGNDFRCSRKASARKTSVPLQTLFPDDAVALAFAGP